MMRVLIIDDDKEGTIPGIIKKIGEYDSNISCKHIRTVKKALEILEEDTSYDLVLLDIMGMDFQQPEESISRLKKAMPYLPIIMLSRQEVPEVITKCIKRGAVSYILKRNLKISPIMLSDGEQTRVKNIWMETLDTIKKFAFEYQPIKRKLYSSREIGWFTKKGEANKSIIKDQIDCLESMQHRRNVKDYFPQIINAHQTSEEVNGEKVKFWQYDIPFYNLISLKTVIFSKRDIDEYNISLIKKALEKILNIMFTKVYFPSQENLINSDKFLKETYIEKYRKRKEEAISLIRTSEEKGAKELDKLLNAQAIWIEAKEYKSPELLLNELFQIEKFKRLMTPPKLYRIHGDLHFDNILVDIDFPEFIQIKFIDPRGFRNPQDIAYDLGKLLHSVNGKYDFIHDGYLKTNIQSFKIKNRGVFFKKLSFNEWVDKKEHGGGSRDITTSHVKLVTEGHMYLYDKIEEFILKEIEEKEYLKDDEFWKFRAYFNEAIHFCTMTPFHVEKDIIRTISIYLRGVELMNKFYDSYINNSALLKS